MNSLAIVGAGSWGTALSIVLAPRFPDIRLWVFEPEVADAICSIRENSTYLPGFPIPSNVVSTNDLAEAMEGAEIVLSVMPSHSVRHLYENMAPLLREDTILVSATKGLERDTLLRPSEIIEQVLRPRFAPQIAVLSGPTFAREVARLDPTALVVASCSEAIAQCVQAAFAGPSFRLYRNSDPVGVEIGGSIKNVVAIGAGVLHGLGFGHNAMAALITRGLAEMTRLAVALGAQAKTLSGLAGLGDLVLTCTGELSRNRSVGIELARGRTLPEIVNSMKMVAEGINTTGAAVELAKRCSVEMPIAERMYEMLHFGVPPREAVRRLMERSLKGE
ncbi:MAG TPA: NAD(P)H-dependent glycerol-3-phosphate dehydrogenase [Bryobacteraceae bacterium]|nr:NAD(P)H-dependent glycerol-3-phosphate dehydrogenase [Bryobacteraceae bacterium]